jgi:hypothetical protein
MAVLRSALFAHASDWGGRGQFSDQDDKPLAGDFHVGIDRNTQGREEIR